MKRINRTGLFAVAGVLIVGALLLSHKTRAASPNPNQPTDPCLYQPMNHVPIAVATAAGPTLLISHMTGMETHICQIPAGVATSSTFKLSQGPTGGVGLQPLTGTMIAIPAHPDMTLLRAAVNNDVYLTTTGTGAQGWIDFVYEVAPFQYATTTPFASSTATPTAAPTNTPAPTATP